MSRTCRLTIDELKQKFVFPGTLNDIESLITNRLKLMKQDAFENGMDRVDRVIVHLEQQIFGRFTPKTRLSQTKPK